MPDRSIRDVPSANLTALRWRRLRCSRSREILSTASAKQRSAGLRRSSGIRPISSPTANSRTPRQSSRKCPGAGPAFLAGYSYPELISIAPVRNEAAAEDLTTELTTFALSHEADALGIAPMDPFYVFEGYTINEPWFIVLALAHNYERLQQLPSDETNGVGVTDIGDQYARHAGFLHPRQLDPLPGI